MELFVFASVILEMQSLLFHSSQSEHSQAKTRKWILSFHSKSSSSFSLLQHFQLVWMILKKNSENGLELIAGKRMNLITYRYL